MFAAGQSAEKKDQSRFAVPPLTDEQRRRAIVIGGVVLAGVTLLVLRARRSGRR